MATFVFALGILLRANPPLIRSFVYNYISGAFNGFVVLYLDPIYVP